MDIVRELKSLSEKINEVAQKIDNLYDTRTSANANNIETSAEGLDDLAEFADTNAGALDDVATILDGVVSAIDDLATYAASIDERLIAIEERGE